MRSIDGVVSDCALGVAELMSLDLSQGSDETVRSSLLSLTTAQSVLAAALTYFVAEFDRRKLARADGQSGTKAWLQAFPRWSGSAAATQMRAVRTLKVLPKLAEAFASGSVTPEHVNQVALLHSKENDEVVRKVEHILVTLAKQSDPADVRRACEHVRHVVHAEDNPDDPDNEANTFAKRQLSLSRMGRLWRLDAQLDVETGAALAIVLEAFNTPPSDDDPRTAGQRLHDAFAEWTRSTLREGNTPSVGGVRPQIGVLVPVHLLIEIHGLGKHVPPVRPDQPTPGEVPAMFRTARPATGDGSTSRMPESAAPARSVTEAGWASLDELSRIAGFPDLDQPCGGLRPEQAWLEGWGPIGPRLTERLVCDSAIFRVVLDPTNGLPLDLGRTHRTAPPWVRKALWARDRGCRWPGCKAKPSWCDAHHNKTWTKDQGNTSVDNLILLCRFHHMLLHEGKWKLHFDAQTGVVAITRPDGRPYELAPTRPWVSANVRSGEPPWPDLEPDDATNDPGDEPGANPEPEHERS